jgi:hypothetical protein
VVLPVVGGDDSLVEAHDRFLELDDPLVGDLQLVGVEVGDQPVQV